MSKHDQALYIRLTSDDVARLDALAEKYPIVTRSALVRAAMRLGLDAIEANPVVLLEQQPEPKRGGARKRKPK